MIEVTVFTDSLKQVFKISKSVSKELINTKYTNKKINRKEKKENGRMFELWKV